ncbi:MAG: Gfo/Idh/MocA family oxidoreductase [Kiritimatiellia bacterium]
MNQKLKVGVVGVGALGGHHARLYSKMESVRLAGVYDIDAERSKRTAREHGTEVFGSLEELAGAVEAASVAVPTDLHAEIAAFLMRKGVHLLVEKPIAATTAEAEAMVKLAREKNLILQVGHVERFNPVIKFLEGSVDRPRFVEAIRLGTFPAAQGGKAPRGTEVSVVLDLMIHDLDIILNLVGSRVSEIRAVGVSVLSSSEDIANVRLKFEGGTVANVTASRISQERMRKIRLFEKDMYVSLDYMKQAGKLCRKTADGITVDPVPMEKGEPLADELSSFVKCVLTRGEPVVSGTHGSEALRLAVEICRNIRENPG